MPKKLTNKHACVNVDNDYHYCLKWALIFALNDNEIETPHKCGSYKITCIRDDVITLKNGVVVDFNLLRVPLTLNEIVIFEENNPYSSNNVLGYDENCYKVVGPYDTTMDGKSKTLTWFSRSMVIASTLYL